MKTTKRILPTRTGTVAAAGVKKSRQLWMLCIGWVVVLLATPALLQAQCAAENKAFNAGESLEYDLHFNWKLVWVKAGTASLKTTATTYNSQPAYKIDLLANGSKRADFFFKMRDTISSTISQRLEPLYYRKGAEEGKRYNVDEAWYSYQNGVSHIRQQRVSTDGTVSVNEETDSRCIHDMLSILAHARSFNAADFREGDRIVFPMTVGKKVEDQTLIYRGKQNITVEGKKVTYRCLAFSLVEYKKKKEKEVITFFITDDDNHLPVRLDLFLNFGSAKAFLNTASGNRYPFNSIVKK